MTVKVFFAGEEVPFTTTIFSGGEINVGISHHKIDPLSSIDIEAYLRSSNDVMELLMVTDAVRRFIPGRPIYVRIPYFPYARQDRVCNPGEALSVKVMADLINSQKYASVTIWDPHSDVTPALIDNVKVVDSGLFLRNLEGMAWGDETVLVAPDAGAIKKVTQLSKWLGSPFVLEIVRADKTRDTITGALSGTVVYGDVKDRHVLIVDDIGDGLGTFVLLGKELKRLGAKRVGLYITHGIFSKGVDILKDAIDEVYCPNIWEDNIKGRNELGILKKDYL